MVKTDKDNFKLFPNKILLKNLWVIKINEVRGWLGQAEKTLENKSTWSNPAPLLSILTCPHLPVSTHVYPDRGPEHLLVLLLRSPCRALSHLPSPFLSLGCHQTLGDAWCSPPPQPRKEAAHLSFPLLGQSVSPKPVATALFLTHLTSDIDPRWGGGLCATLLSILMPLAHVPLPS